MAFRGASLLGCRIRIQKILFRFHVVTAAGIRPAAKALRDHAPRAGRCGRRKQVIQALRPQAIAERKGAVEMPQITQTAQRSHLVHDDVGGGIDDRRAHGRAIKSIGHDRFGARVLAIVCVLAAVWVMPMTVWPAATSSGSRRLPRAPVAPVTKTRMVQSSAQPCGR